jgi:hypothetical protein
MGVMEVGVGSVLLFAWVGTPYSIVVAAWARRTTQAPPARSLLYKHSRGAGPTAPMSGGPSAADAFSQRVVNQVIARLKEHVDHEGLDTSVLAELRQVSRKRQVFPAVSSQEKSRE